jgi:hypothetical protein
VFVFIFNFFLSKIIDNCLTISILKKITAGYSYNEIGAPENGIQEAQRLASCLRAEVPFGRQA